MFTTTYTPINPNSNSNLVWVYIDVMDYLDTLDFNFPEGSSMHKSLEEAAERYPDLKINFVEIGGYQLCSKEINLFADRVDIRISKGLYIAEPYTIDSGIKMHSEPPNFVVGLDTPNGFGITPYQVGLDELETAEISIEAKRIIKDYLASRPPVKW